MIVQIGGKKRDRVEVLNAEQGFAQTFGTERKRSLHALNPQTH